MIDQILLDGGPGETRIALMASGRAVELHYYRDDDPPPVGTAYLARVRKIAPGHHGAFLDLDGKIQGFLKVRKGTAMPVEGSALAVAIRAAATADKLAICTTTLPDGLPAAPIGVTAPALIHAPSPPWGPLLAAHPAAAIITDSHDLASLAKPAHATVRREPTPLFEDFGVEAEIARIITGRFALGMGASLRQTATPALVAWDVDLGGADVKGAQAAETINLAAAAEVARQARLQHLGGLMVVDFLKMDRTAQGRVRDALTAALSAHPVPTQVGPFSQFGLLELSRTRNGRPLAEILTAAPTPAMNLATAGYGLLRAARRALAADPGAALVLRLSPALARWLEAGPLRHFTAATGITPRLELDPARDAAQAEAYTRRP